GRLSSPFTWGNTVKTIILISWALLISFNIAAQEGGIVAPLGLESAKVLPVGIRNVQFINSRIDAIHKYNNSNTPDPLGKALNKKVTWETSIKGKRDVYERAKLRGLLKDNDVDTKEYIGRTTGEVDAAVEAQVPVIAYGVTKKLTMALVIPYITSDVS